MYWRLINAFRHQSFVIIVSYHLYTESSIILDGQMFLPLNESQRAMIAARIEQISHGGNRRNVQDANLHLDRSNASELLNVSQRSIAHAKEVQGSGTPELITATEAKPRTGSIGGWIGPGPQI